MPSFNCTRRFRELHIRCFGKDDVVNTWDGQKGMKETTRKMSAKRAYRTRWSSDKEVTVMFMYEQTLHCISHFLQENYVFEGKQGDFEFRDARIFCVVTTPVHGSPVYDVVENAEGFAGRTNQNGFCDHYVKVLTDEKSIISRKTG